MPYRLLLDEMIERNLVEYLEKLDHDVERVVDCRELGPGTDDSRVVEYAEGHDRLVVTDDDDYLANHDALERIGVLFRPDARLSAFDTANVINEISNQVPQTAVVEHDEAYHLSEEWI